MITFKAKKQVSKNNRISTLFRNMKNNQNQITKGTDKN